MTDHYFKRHLDDARLFMRLASDQLGQITDSEDVTEIEYSQLLFMRRMREGLDTNARMLDKHREPMRKARS